MRNLFLVFNHEMWHLCKGCMKWIDIRTESHKDGSGNTCCDLCGAVVWEKK